MSLESFGENPVQPEPTNEKLENRYITYKLESGIEADLTIKEFSPLRQEKKESIDIGDLENDTGRAVVLLPGLAMNPEDNIMKGLGQAYAESSKAKTFIIKTDLKKQNTNKEDYENLDLFYEEAIAISKFIKDNNLKDVTLAGYSLGGPKVIDIAHILQNDESVKINGVILLSSPGLYEQEPGELKKNLVKDSFSTPTTVLKEKNFSKALGRGARGALSVVKNLAAGSLSSEFREKITRDFSEMEHLNERAKEIKVPVILISGAEDKVVDVNKIVPPGKVHFSEKEEYLKENIFNESPYVRMITAKKMGKHGLPVFRAEEVASVSMHLLERFYRNAR